MKATGKRRRLSKTSGPPSSGPGNEYPSSCYPPLPTCSHDFGVGDVREVVRGGTFCGGTASAAAYRDRCHGSEAATSASGHLGLGANQAHHSMEMREGGRGISPTLVQPREHATLPIEPPQAVDGVAFPVTAWEQLAFQELASQGSQEDDAAELVGDNVHMSSLPCYLSVTFDPVFNQNSIVLTTSKGGDWLPCTSTGKNNLVRHKTYGVKMELHRLYYPGGEGQDVRVKVLEVFGKNE
eukprot:TRINITY_DN10472_c0_g1_i1.p2 TRINITY_DN10472_c0_g1~~TRINITY_DN10472_c0_g1_i1.p2  ORF type:complete len:239 (-),score=9.64 TRINITY_DN10472_c0_g1_i1:275-991(-)